MKQWTCLMLVAALLVGASTAVASSDAEMQAQLQALQQRVMELEAKQSDQAINQRNAELVRQMVSELASNPQAMAADTGITAGYDKRFFIKSADDQFKIEFDTLMQFRHSYLLANDGDSKMNAPAWSEDDGAFVPGDSLDSSANGFEFERARLIIQGHVLKDLKFKIQYEFDDDNHDGGFLQDYILAYSFMPELGIQLGRYKSAYGKQHNTSAGRLMMVDRSLANSVFNIDRGTGVELFGAVPIEDLKLHYRAGIFNGFRDVRNGVLSDNDNNPALAARVTLPIMGATPADFENESDLMYHENPVMQFGASFAYANNRDEDHFAGGDGNGYPVLGEYNIDGFSETGVFPLGGEATMFGADASLKCQGLSITMEGFYQHVDGDNKEIPTFDDAFGDPVLTARDYLDGMELDNYGWYTQAGYFIVPKIFELTSRIGGVCVDNAKGSYEYAGGWNWYLSGQDLKLSMDITYIDEMPIGFSSSSANMVGIDNESLLMVRTQLQFQF